MTRPAASRVVAALTGPLLIVAMVVVARHQFVLGDLLAPPKSPDFVSFFVPNHCFLGDALASGDVPGWNPHVLGGNRFAGDPQSGWMNLPAMALYTVLPCHIAAGLFPVLLAAIGGLGAYLFLRAERLSRIAATTGGVVLAAAIASPRVFLVVPFAGLLAWAPVMLAGASRSLRAARWGPRIGWCALAAAAWGQIAASHLSHGLVLGSGLLAFYVAAELWRRRGEDGFGVGRSALHVGLLAGALPAVNLAFFVPRLAFLPHSSLGLGYEGLRRLQAEAAGTPEIPFEVGPGLPAGWITELFAGGRSAFVRDAAVLLCLAALLSRRHRTLAMSLGAFALLCYVASLESVARAVAPSLRSLPLGDFYLHAPERFEFGVVAAVPLLVAVGLETLWEDRRALWAAAGGLVLWVAVPLALGLDAIYPVLLWAGLLALALAVGAGVVRPLARAAVPAVVAVTVVTGAFVVGGPGAAPPWTSFPPGDGWIGHIPTDAWFRPGPLLEELDRSNDHGRLMSLDPRLTGAVKVDQLRRLQANRRALLFGHEEVQGYNPVQILRFWTAIRALSGERIQYNSAALSQPYPSVVDLLGIRWVIRDRNFPPTRDAEMAALERGWALFRLPRSPGRVSVLGRHIVVDDDDAALAEIIAPAFDATRTVVLESEPGVPESEVTGAVARYSPVGSQGAVVEVTTPGPAVVLVRNVFDPNWRARVDGEAAEVLVANHFLQAVAVPAGTHTIELAYEDPAVGYGVAGTVAVLALMAAAAVLLERRARGGRGRAHESTGG